ncbi:MAG: hypothetical protein ACFFAS_20380 [Promethearchaeota archaeon]
MIFQPKLIFFYYHWKNAGKSRSVSKRDPGLFQPGKTPANTQFQPQNEAGDLAKNPPEYEKKIRKKR